MTIPETPNLKSRAEVAYIYNTTTTTVGRWIKAGLCREVFVGGLSCIPDEDVDKLETVHGKQRRVSFDA